jgi:hypothetical protein
MKNLILSLSVVLASALSPVLANEKTGSDPITEAVFAKKFSGAENVIWSKVDDSHQKVSFTLGGIRAEAFFGTDGELLGTVRNLFYSQLPLIVIQAVNNRFNTPVVVEVKEISNLDGTTYKIQLEQKDKKYSVRVNSLGDIMESTRIKS